MVHALAALKSWLNKFLSSCLHTLKIPKIWRKALVVAIPKPMKLLGDPKSYQTNLCFVYPLKILERFIYTYVKPIINPLLPYEQAGFWQGRSTVDQVILLTREIGDSFLAKKKAGTMFVDLTAAYNIVWYHGLTCKLLHILPDRHMVTMIMKHVQNCSFTITTGDDTKSRLQHLYNGILQGSVLDPFNIYTHDMPALTAKKFAYADDLAVVHSTGNCRC